MDRRKPLIVLVYAAFFAATNWPVLPLVNRVEPEIARVPLLVFWMLVWSLGVSLFHVWVGLAVWRDPTLPESEE